MPVSDVSGPSPFQHRLISIFERREPKLKAYARWRISQVMNGRSRGGLLPGALDCDDIVYGAISYAIFKFDEEEIAKNPRKLNEEEEVYRKLKRRIDTIIKNSMSLKERRVTFSIDKYSSYDSEENVISLLEVVADKNQANPEENMIFDDFVRYVSFSAKNKLIVDLARISTYNGTVDPRDQAKELGISLNLTYEARVKLKDFLEDFLGYSKRRLTKDSGEER